MPNENRSPLPDFYDDLDASLAEAWHLLIRAAVDRRSPVHTIAIATVGLDGRPKVRTVVLRHTDAPARCLRFHTDARSEKFAEFAANPAVQVLAYDPARKIQLRLSGSALLHRGDDVARAAWQRSQPQSRQCYRQDAAPGTRGSPSSAAPDALLAPAAHDGEENFTAVEIAIEEIEWLYLAAPGHRRARFRWPDGQLDAVWLAP